MTSEDNKLTILDHISSYLHFWLIKLVPNLPLILSIILAVANLINIFTIVKYDSRVVI